jgi:hypothetical protein
VGGHIGFLILSHYPGICLVVLSNTTTDIRVIVDSLLNINILEVGFMICFRIISPHVTKQLYLNGRSLQNGYFRFQVHWV